MGKLLIIIGIMILVVGLGIFSLPYIAPPSGDSAELIARTSKIGGGFIGVGAILTLLGFIQRKKG